MGGYKESKIFDILKRKSVIIRYIFFIALIFIVTIMLIVQATKENETQEIVYKENSEVDYKVYLKENDFFKERYLGKDNQYIASLIDYIEVHFDYELDASIKNVDYKYTYKIVAETKVEDKTTHNPLYEFSEDLVEQKEYDANTTKKLKISEPIKVDYNRYNDIINRFVDMYDLKNSSSTVTINMYVNVLDDVNKENSENNTPAISLTIPLTMETMAIDFESNSINENDVSIRKTITQKKYGFTTILLIIIDIMLVVKLVVFIKDTKDEKAVYNMRLRKIMSNYGSYIQKLNNEFNFEDYQILEIKSFEDLLQIRETITQPILMTEKSSAMETYFFIPSEKNIYIYELKAGSLRNKRGKRYKEKEENRIETTI